MACVHFARTRSRARFLRGCLSESVCAPQRSDPALGGWSQCWSRSLASANWLSRSLALVYSLIHKIRVEGVQKAHVCVYIHIYIYKYIYIYIYIYIYMHIYIYIYVYIYIYISYSTQTERHRLTPHRKINRIYFTVWRYVYVDVFHSVKISNESRRASPWLHTITQWHTLIERNPSPRGGFLFTMFPHQEPVPSSKTMCKKTPLEEPCTILRGGSSYTRFLMREHSK